MTITDYGITDDGDDTKLPYVGEAFHYYSDQIVLVTPFSKDRVKRHRIHSSIASDGSIERVDVTIWHRGKKYRLRIEEQ